MTAGPSRWTPAAVWRESAETRHCCICHLNTVTLLYPCQNEALRLCRAHGCSPCFCHPITSLLYGNRTTSATGKLKRVCLDTIASSLLITHVPLCAFTPRQTNTLGRRLFCAGWNQMGQRRFFGECGVEGTLEEGRPLLRTLNLRLTLPLKTSGSGCMQCAGPLRF